MLRRHIALLIVIRLSDGDVKCGGPLGAFSRRAGYEPAPGFTFSLPIIIIPNNTNSYTYSHPNLNFLQYTIQILILTRNAVCPSCAWIENRPHSMPSICLAWNLKHIIVQWVGIGTHTHKHTHTHIFITVPILIYFVIKMICDMFQPSSDVVVY